MYRLYASVLKTFCLILFLSAAANLSADNDKRALDHTDYDRWNTISSQQISSDGQWIMYTLTDGAIESKSTLIIQKNGSTKQYVVARGGSARFTADSRFAIYRIAPDPDVVKKLKEKKAKANEIPGPQMELLDLATGGHFTVDRVRQFSSPEENGEWMAYLLEKPFEQETVKEQKSGTVESYEVTPEGLKKPEKPLKLKKRPTNEPEETEEKPAQKQQPKAETSEETEEAKKKPAEKKKDAGTVLVVRNLNTGLERRFPNVVSFQFSKQGDSLAFVTSVPPQKPDKDDEIDPAMADGIHVLDLKKQTLSNVVSGLGNYRNVSFNEKGSELVFITDKDDYESKTSSWSLYHWKRGAKEAKQLATEGAKGIPNGWWIPSNSSPNFSEDNRRIYFTTAPVPDSVMEERANGDQEKDEKEKEQKAKLDIWHWQDPLLQPQQLLQVQQEKLRSYVAVYDVGSRKIVQLADKDFPVVMTNRRSKADVAVGFTNLPYRKMLSWDVPGFQDTYLVNLKSGERSPILQKSKSSPRLSPDGKFVTWFDPETRKWFAASTGSDPTPVEISKGIEFPLQDELHDTPSLANAYGSAGWLKDDSAFLIYDRFDIWQVDPTGSKPSVCLTESKGRENKIRFRFVGLDPEARAIDPTQPIMLSAFDEKTKASGYYQINPKNAGETSNESNLNKLIMLDESLGRIVKAKESDDVMFTRSTFQRFPDIWTSKVDFQKISRISNANPQQSEYLWGSAELVKWKAADGQELEGLLYRPENFDPSQKYPLMVYFYERNSETLHRYYAPSAGRSIINHSFYVSRGYVLFVPDIPYKTGEPGPSAANAVIPGTQAIIDMGFIDEKRVGMQGHSWGGYQTAYLVTQTDMFACAESGAPVSNMTSAYGGIRWGSGMSRMFQYERTQSRIGDTLWAAREKYLANSPLFHADKINTPLLILHNDEDGAVPWYQGIELFVALRRLEKPAWLLNYNGNPHWVMGQQNRRDFAIRMQQFFDHYLKGAPEPEWMAYGVPAVDKGENFGLELMEPEKEETSTETGEKPE